MNKKLSGCQLILKTKTHEKCREMAKKYQWKLKTIRPTKDKILKVDCVFDGEQTSFEDERYD